MNTEFARSQLDSELAGCSIVGDPTGNIISRTAFLLSLQDNGGPTLTHALWFIKPAIDAGDSDLLSGG